MVLMSAKQKRLLRKFQEGAQVDFPRAASSGRQHLCLCHSSQPCMRSGSLSSKTVCCAQNDCHFYYAYVYTVNVQGRQLRPYGRAHQTVTRCCVDAIPIPYRKAPWQHLIIQTELLRSSLLQAYAQPPWFQCFCCSLPQQVRCLIQHYQHSLSEQHSSDMSFVNTSTQLQLHTSL